MKKNKTEKLSFRPITGKDLEFLYRVYASTRLQEMAETGWSEQQKEEFLRMQFNLQHTQYMQNYQAASFEIVMVNAVPAGRLYVDRGEKEIRIIDLALLPEYRGRGIGSAILKDLITEAEKKLVPLTLHVEHFNPALNLYERLSFKKKHDTGVYFLMERAPLTTKEYL